jgi:alkaline phosphatase D
VRVDRTALARYGLNVTDVEEAVAADGSGDDISTVVDGQKRYTVALHLPEAYRTDPDAMRRIPLKAPGGEQVTLDQYLNGEADSPSRQLMGSVQADWLAARLSASGATWQVLGQQVLMARMNIPLSVASAFTPETLAEFMLAQSTPKSLRSQSQNDLVNQRRVPYNLDAWDGYPAARESVLGMARALGKNLVSLAGDTHNAWASNLTDASGRRVGVEFATASVSSPGFERLLPLIANSLLADGFLAMVKDLRYAETSRRGYVLLTLTPGEVRSDWIEVSTVFSRSYTARLAKSLHALPGAGQLEVLPV